MESTEKLIASLAQTATPVVPSPYPFTLFVRWFAGSLLYVAVILFFMGVREDIATKIHAPLFLAELAALICIIAGAGISAMVLSFPDMFQKRWLAFAPVIPLIAFCAILTLEWLSDNPPAPQPVHGAECLLCITLLSLLPGALMLYILRKQAGVHYYLSGAIALLAAAGVGCLALRLSEKTDSIRHLLEWHYLPMIGFGVVGLWLGRKILKW